MSVLEEALLGFAQTFGLQVAPVPLKNSPKKPRKEKT
jgi:hypothetical protein